MLDFFDQLSGTLPLGLGSVGTIPLGAQDKKKAHDKSARRRMVAG